jgi:hypothetical protein
MMAGIIPGVGALVTWTIIPDAGVQIFCLVGHYPFGRPSWLLF